MRNVRKCSFLFPQPTERKKGFKFRPVPLFAQGVHYVQNVPQSKSG